MKRKKNSKMSLDVHGSYEVCCALGQHLRSNEIGLIIKYLERNLWEYPTKHFNSPDSSSYDNWGEFLAKDWRNPLYFQWDEHSFFFEEDSIEYENDGEGDDGEDENDGEGDDGEDESDTRSFFLARNVVTIAFGNTDIYVKVEKQDQAKVREYMRKHKVHIPSTLDVLPRRR